MSAPNPNPNYAPEGYEQISPGHYRRKVPDSSGHVIELLNEESMPEPQICPLAEIAALVRSLTYGEMVDLAKQVWNCRGDGFAEESLPAILHRWSNP